MNSQQDWIVVGARGVRLEAVRCGGAYRTSREAVSRFLAGTAGLCADNRHSEEHERRATASSHASSCGILRR